MELSVIWSGVFALLGTIVGGAVTFLVQWNVTLRNELASERTEVRELVRQFLTATKGPERLVENRRSGEAVPWQQMGDQTGVMWLAYQSLQAFSPPQIAIAAEKYVNAIYEEFVIEDLNIPIGQIMSPARQEFLTTVRENLSRL